MRLRDGLLALCLITPVSGWTPQHADAQPVHHGPLTAARHEYPLDVGSAGRRLIPVSSIDFFEGISRVWFEAGSAALSEAAKRTLDKQANVLTRYPCIAATVEGHTDKTEVASVRASLELGERRAKATRRYLISKGIEPRRIKTFSFGWFRSGDSIVWSVGFYVLCLNQPYSKKGL